MKAMRERRQQRGLRELRLVLPDARLNLVRRETREQVARLKPEAEADALDWVEAVSEFDNDR